MKEGWEIMELGEVCEFVRGPFGGSLKKSFFTKSGFAVYEQQHAIHNQFSEIRYFIDAEKFKQMKRFELKPNDLIMSCSGTMGKVAIVPQDIQKGIINQALLKLTCKDKLKVDYLKLWMDSNQFVEEIEKNTVGAAIKNVASVKVLKTIKIPIPPLQEQQRIVSILDRAFTAIDKVRANEEKNLQNAAALFESYLQKVFENIYWNWKTLNEISENLDSKRIPIAKNKRISGDIPYYGASGIVDYVSDFIFNENLLCISEDGANLLARSYPIAFSISGKTWVNNHAHILRFKSLTTQSFIEYYINSVRVDDFVSGMAQPKLNQKNLNRIPVPFPSLEEQKIILRRIRYPTRPKHKNSKLFTKRKLMP